MKMNANSSLPIPYRVAVRAAIAFPGFEFGTSDLFRR
jgi:hypothetical protein